MRISTISKIPIPEPKTPRTSDTPASPPKIAEPIMVTEGMYLFSNASTGAFDLQNPGICTSASSKFCAALFGDKPPSSTHSLPNTITIPIMNRT